MEHDPTSADPKPLYDENELWQISGGNEELFNRLIAQAQAKARLEMNPGDANAQKNYEIMSQVVAEYQQSKNPLTP